MFAEIRKDYLNPHAPCPLPFVVCNIGQTENQGPISRPEGFPFHHMLWITNGQGIFSFDGKKVELGPGEGLFCKKDIPHCYERSSPLFSTRWITFLGGEGAMAYYRIPSAFTFRATPALLAAADELDHLCGGSSTVLSRSAAGYAWLAEWLKSEFEPSATMESLIRQYLENHFSEPLTLDDIAAQAGMSRFALCRYYKENLGVTVMEQLKRIRVAKAKQFLRYASCSIEEVARLCGYESPSYFGKIFREETGRTPREYRFGHEGGTRK